MNEATGVLFHLLCLTVNLRTSCDMVRLQYTAAIPLQ